MAGGRSLPNGGGTIEIDPPAPVMAASADFGEGVGLDPQGTGQLAAAQDLDQVALVGEAGRHERGDVGGVALDDAQGTDVDRGVLHPERVREAAQLGDPLHEGQLAALEAHRDGVACALALGAAAGGLAALAGDAAADPLATDGSHPAGGRSSWTFMVSLSRLRPADVTSTRCGTRAIIPRISGRSGSTLVRPMPAQAEGPRGPRCFGLVPMADRTWVVPGYSPS